MEEQQPRPEQLSHEQLLNRLLGETDDAARRALEDEARRRLAHAPEPSRRAWPPWNPGEGGT